MSNQVVTIIGSGLNDFRARNAQKRNLPADAVAIMNPEDASACIAVSGSSVAVSTGAAVALPATSLPSRRALALQNVGGGTVMIGGWSGIGVADGFPLLPGTMQTYMANPNITIWGIASGVDSAVRVMEIA